METPQARLTSVRPEAQRAQEKAPAPEAGGASFQALLDKLERHVDGLAGRNLEDPGQLPGVVDDARASLDAALNLGRDLLEAYREAHIAG